MGKVKKLKPKNNNSLVKTTVTKKAALAEPTKHPANVDSQEDPFLSLKLNLDDLIDIPKKTLSEDTKSILSYKSAKTKKSPNKIIKKKDKLNLKRKLLMKKIEVVKQVKKELKIRDKRKNTALMGDTNPLHDALPSLEPLLKAKSNFSYKIADRTKKKKAIEKAKQRKKKSVNDIEVFKKALKDKTFKTSPFETISNHIRAVVDIEKRNVKM